MITPGHNVESIVCCVVSYFSLVFCSDQVNHTVRPYRSEESLFMALLTSDL
jgi:hypothetical protein